MLVSLSPPSDAWTLDSLMLASLSPPRDAWTVDSLMLVSLSLVKTSAGLELRSMV